MKHKRPRKFGEEYNGYFYAPPDEMLEAIGRVAVASASVDETLHLLYWYYLDVLIDVAPIITRDMRPNKLADDIIKVAVASGVDEIEVAHLRDVIADYKELGEKRNKYIHWFLQQPKNRRHKKHPLVPPAYKIGRTPETVTLKGLNDLALDLAWVDRLLTMHGTPETEYKELRRDLGYWTRYIFPAPWREKQLPPNSKRSPPRVAPKRRKHSRPSSKTRS